MNDERPGASRWLRAWGVTAVAGPVESPSSTVVFGSRAGVPVVLKVARAEEERRGGRLMARWSRSGARGAAEVLEHEGDALLLRRAVGRRDLATLAREDDAAATDVLAAAVRLLHAGGGADPAGLGLPSLDVWFRDLTGRTHADPALEAAAGIARRVLGATRPADVVTLHGDVHHGNVLDAGGAWVVIDPKGLVGHRAFDYANLFVNPDEATAVRHRDARLSRVAAAADLDPGVLADWVMAWCGLTLCWAEAVPNGHDRAARDVLAGLLHRARATPGC